jgi:hypothetical protein
MPATLTEDGKPAQLRSGVQPAIASSADDATLAAELELISILDGPAFHGSSRSRAFLRFVVEEVLAGRQDTLKERTIGVAVMGKTPNYDTGADSTVRVRANEVRKRLAAHYESTAPKAGIRIELPLGTYAPRFTPVAAPRFPPLVKQKKTPPPMLLWQLATPTLIAVFLALAAICGGVDSSDAFSRFWDQAMTGRTEVSVVVDSPTGTSISPAMADAAMPIERLADTLQVPVHVEAAGATPRPGSCVIRLSLTEKPAGRPASHIGGALLWGRPRDHAIWVWAENAESLRAAAQILTSRSGFPDVD